MVLMVKNLSANAGDIREAGSVPGSGKCPERGMATHPSIFAWRIRWTEGLSEVQSIGSQRVRQNWNDLALTHAPLEETR